MPAAGAPARRRRRVHPETGKRDFGDRAAEFAGTLFLFSSFTSGKSPYFRLVTVCFFLQGRIPHVRLMTWQHAHMDRTTFVEACELPFGEWRASDCRCVVYIKRGLVGRCARYGEASRLLRLSMLNCTHPLLQFSC